MKILTDSWHAFKTLPGSMSDLYFWEMLKAKLIESPEYYSRRKWTNILQILILGFPGGILFNARHFPTPVVITAGVVFVLAIILLVRNVQRYKALMGQRTIRIDQDHVMVEAKDQAGSLDIPLSAVDKIILPSAIHQPIDSFEDLSSEIKGKGVKNYIILKMGDHQHRFDFEVDSYYLGEQFEKIVRGWSEKGYTVERV